MPVLIAAETLGLLDVLFKAYATPLKEQLSPVSQGFVGLRPYLSHPMGGLLSAVHAEQHPDILRLEEIILPDQGGLDLLRLVLPRQIVENYPRKLSLRLFRHDLFTGL
jgi:hypothetical protein